MILLIGPFVAGIGLVAVFFVFRHKAVQKESLYSSRRSQIERKVRAARQRTLAPVRKAEQKAAAATAVVEAPPPDQTVVSPPGQPIEQPWEASPTAPTAPAAAPAEPVYTPPPAPAYTPPPAPAYTPPPAAEPAYTPPASDQPAWTPGPAPAEPAAPAEAAPAGASWSVVEGDKPDASGPQPEKEAAAAPAGAWSLASGEAPSEIEKGDGEEKKPSALLAVAQYVVFVIGLILVLVGVLVMVATSKVA